MHAKAAEHQYDEVVDGYFARHRVKPGITGWRKSMAGAAARTRRNRSKSALNAILLYRELVHSARYVYPARDTLCALEDRKRLLSRIALQS